MSRRFAVLLVAALAGPASAQVPDSPRILDAKVEKDKLFVDETVIVPTTREVAVQVVVNGKTVTEKRLVTAYVTEVRTVAMELKTVKATDAAGKAIAADKLADLLKQKTPVVVTSAPVAEKYRALFKEKVVFLELAPTPPPKAPVPPPPGR